MEIQMTHKLSKYMSGLRNRDKRDYAHRYLIWMANDRQGDEPMAKCSFMAAQSVRMEIFSHLRKDV